MNSFKFVDLFAGLGGFHYALESLGGECVFVSEIDVNLRNLYHENHKVSKSIIFFLRNSISSESFFCEEKYESILSKESFAKKLNSVKGVKTYDENTLILLLKSYA